MSQSNFSGVSRNLEEALEHPPTASPDPAGELSIRDPENHDVHVAEMNVADADGDIAVALDTDDRVHAPPPRIAARLIYPPMNQSRRKDSAASSRRNSISSVHSRSSHGGNVSHQSKYIAQHFRRASILEDRKARLADRAAHAEKVRLRAALAKAAAKDISASEERALAAALAREKNLADIAATCAEEVKRAKAVAETMKEKREREIEKMKVQMEERMAEAERRREEFRIRNSSRVRGRERGQSLLMKKPALVGTLAGADEVRGIGLSPMSPKDAASKIQWWWRAVKRGQAIAGFAQLGLTIDGVRETSFEKVTELLAQERVLLATARVLRICGLKEGESGSVNEMAAVRTFLSAFLILGHPAQVLNNRDGKGEQEQVGVAQTKPIRHDSLADPQSQDLVGKARDLLISFENTLSRLTVLNNYTPPPSLLLALLEVYAAFHNAFIAWKARDSSSLVEVMVMQFVELDAIWQTVKDSTDGSVDQVYRQSIQDNQLKLMVRIKRLAGPQQGKKIVLEAVRQARKARQQKKPTGDTRPRVADNAILEETAMGHLGAKEQPEPSNPVQTPTPPATPSRKGQPPPHANVHVGRIQGLLPDNRIVVHELAIDKEFRIAADEYREQQEHLLKPLFSEMRNTMRADNQEAHFLLLLEVAKYIREKLQRLVRPGNSMHTSIAELLDTDVAHRQFTTGSFSYEKFFQSMGSLLPKLCAPIRDEEVKELVDTRLSQGNYVDRLESLMGFIDLMLSDYANYLLRLAAPQLIESATPYEAKAFAAAAQGGYYDLSAAGTAWRTARQKIVAEATRRDPEGISHPRSRATPDRIYAQMLVDLFTQLSPIPREHVPEMLRLDHKRIIRAGHLTRRIITTGAILLQCKNILKRDVRAPWKMEAGRIFTILEAAESTPTQSAEQTVDSIVNALEAGRSIPVATKAHLRGFVARLVAASAEAASRREPEPREPVLRLLLSRLRGHIFGRLAAASASEKVKVTSTAGERLAGLGLAEFVEKVRDMVDEMSRVGAVDRDAHGPWWETVAEKVEKLESTMAEPPVAASMP